MRQRQRRDCCSHEPKGGHRAADVQNALLVWNWFGFHLDGGGCAAAITWEGAEFGWLVWCVPCLRMATRVRQRPARAQNAARTSQRGIGRRMCRMRCSFGIGLDFTSTGADVPLQSHGKGRTEQGGCRVCHLYMYNQRRHAECTAQLVWLVGWFGACHACRRSAGMATRMRQRPARAECCSHGRRCSFGILMSSVPHFGHECTPACVPRYVAGAPKWWAAASSRPCPPRLRLG